MFLLMNLDVFLILKKKAANKINLPRIIAAYHLALAAHGHQNKIEPCCCYSMQTKLILNFAYLYTAYRCNLIIDYKALSKEEEDELHALDECNNCTELLMLRDR